MHCVSLISLFCRVLHAMYVLQLERLSIVCQTRESQSLGLEDIFFLFRNDMVRRLLWVCSLLQREAWNVTCITLFIACMLCVVEHSDLLTL